MFLSIGPRSRSRSRIRFHQIAGAVLVFFVLLSILRMARRVRLARSPQRSIYDYTEGKTTPLGKEAIISSPGAEMEEFLQDLVTQHGLTQDTEFHARRIQPKFSARHKRESMTAVRKKFGPRHGFISMRASSSEEADHHELKRASQQQGEQPLRPGITATNMGTGIDPTVLKLPLLGPPKLPDQVDASALLFGISTTYSRLVASNASLLHDWARWLTDGHGRSNGAELLLVLHRASASEVGHVKSKLRAMGIDAVVRSSGEGEAVGGNAHDADNTWSYLELAGQLARRALEITSKNEEAGKNGRKKEKKYLGLVDDDVFFPSMHRLLTQLGEFDPSQNAYVGLPSERVDWTTTEGGNVTLTYGGGAVFLTRPMAITVSKMPCARQPQPEEAAAATMGQWDERLYQCVTAHHNIRFHIIPSLYTPEDDNASANEAGGYESGLQPLTLHHYRQRHQQFAPSRAHMITSLAGESSFLQRFWFRGDGWILVNGHSIVEYPDGVDVVPSPKTSRQKMPPVLVTQQPHELAYTKKNRNNDRVAESRLANRITIDSDATKKQERKDQKVVTWRGVKRVWRHLDSKILRDEAGAIKEVWQAYVKRAGVVPEYADDKLDPSNMVHRQDVVSDLDSIIVLVWEEPS
ncbi:hypothetical protein PG990_009371 [Apiospora arundinis]